MCCGLFCSTKNVSPVRFLCIHVEFPINTCIFSLRNLFFRTAYLLLMDIQPVFILDGEAPQLKHQTIQKRNEIQFIGARPRTQTKTQDPDNVKTKKKELKGRTRFKYVLKQCSDLLATMGKCDFHLLLAMVLN